MNEERVSRDSLVVPPCREACPAGIDVARYVRCIREGRFDEALAVIRERIPFPSICGHACYSPCEAQCGNRQFGDPIAIRALKRAAAEKGGELWRKSLTLSPDTGKRVAIIGSGPSGLTAAYYLATLGHKVTVLEALDKPGGMLRVGIPEYRLPREALDKEIAYLTEIGVEIETGRRVDSVDALLQQGYDAVYAACGAHKGAKLGIPGEDTPRIFDGVSFLRRINQGEDIEVGERVAIIGGGNTGFDSARCAIRLGAKDVTLIYRRTEAEMTAYEEEVGSAIVEGVKLRFLATPVSIATKNSGLEMTLIRMELGSPDAGGRPSPIPVTGSEFTMEIDTAIIAIGQLLDISPSMGLPLSERNLVEADAETKATGTSGVFAGGDMVSGPASIIEAIAAGRKAAASIDKFLGGTGTIDQELAPPEQEVVVVDFEAEDKSRVSTPCAPLTDRACSFSPVELGLTDELAIKEAERCRNCDARQFKVEVHTDACKECGYCIEVCGLDVFAQSKKANKRGYKPVLADKDERCVGCMLCFFACPDFSIEIAKK